MQHWFWTLALCVGGLTAMACGGDDSDSHTDDSGGSSSGGSSSGGSSSGGSDSGGSDSGGSGGSGSGTSGSGAASTSSGGGSGGSGGSGDSGAASSSSNGGDAGAAGMAGGGPTATLDCEVELLTSTVSEHIASVGIVEFFSDLADLDRAYIDFGRTTSYGMRAPVDLSEPDFRTLLLGMAFDSTYHYRIVLQSGGDTCISDDQVLETGTRPAGAPADAVVTHGNAGSSSPGFILTSALGANGWVTIFNQHGELVWASTTSVPAWPSRARLSYDGKQLLVAELNVQRSLAAGQLELIELDGSSSEVLPMGSMHHDFAVAPDNGFYYLRAETEGSTSGEGCDSIYKYPGDTLVYDLADAFPSHDTTGPDDACHAGAISYNAFDETLTVAVRNFNAFVNVSTSGTLDWVLGSDDSDFALDSAQWQVQYGMHRIDATTMAFFNNEPMAATSFGRVIELDHDDNSAEFTLGYEIPSSLVLGDAQFLPNGHLLFTSSTLGVAYEVTPTGGLVQQMAFGNSGGLASHRSTLYGPPPR